MPIPLVFMRLKHIDKDGNYVSMMKPYVKVRQEFIVVLPKYYDYTYISTAWQDNPKFPEGEIHIPSIDILVDEDTYIFDSDDSQENHRQAILKMKELWSQVDIT